MSVAADPDRLHAARNDDRGAVRRAEELFVLLAWIWCAIVLVRYVARYASPLPFTDDVLMARYVDPGRPLTWDLLWAQHNEHRIPLVKLAYVATVGLFHDLRAGSWLQVVVLLAVSAALLVALRKRTGVTRASDALVPLCLLNTGNTENLLSSFQVSLALPAAIAGALLVAALASTPPALGAPSRWTRVAWLWIAILAMVACGSAGLAQAPALAVWPIAVAWSARANRASGSTASFAIAAIGALLLVAYATLYFVGFDWLPHESELGLGRALLVALQLLACALGANALPFWPISGILAGLFVAAGCVVAFRAARDGRAREVLPFAASLGAALLLAASVGLGRGGDGPEAGLSNRYVVLAVIGLCVAYSIWRAFGRGVATRLLELVAFAAVLASFVADYSFAFLQGHGRAIVVKRFEKQALAGAGVAELAHAQWSAFFYSEEELARELAEWRKAGYLDDVLPGEKPATELDATSLLPALAKEPELERPLVARTIDAHDAVLVQGRARIELAVPAAALRVAGQVALDPCGADPRWRVRVEAIAEDGTTRIVLERELARHVHPNDGNVESASLDVELGLPHPSRLVIVLEPAGKSASPRRALLTGVAFAR